MLDLLHFFDWIPLYRVSLAELQTGNSFWTMLFSIACAFLFVGCTYFVSAGNMHKVYILQKDARRDARQGILWTLLGIAMLALGEYLLYPLLILFAILFAWFAWRVFEGIIATFLMWAENRCL